MTEVIGGQAKLPIKPGAALGSDVLFESYADFVFGLGAKFDFGQLFGARTQPMADVIARNHKIAAGIVDTAHQQVNMGMFGVPVLDGDPVEPGAEIGLHLLRKIARESLEVFHLARVFRRDDEAEVVAILVAAAGKADVISSVGRPVKGDAPFAVPADALALEVRQVRRQGSRAESAALMADDAGLDDDPPVGTEQPVAAEAGAPTAKG